MVVRNKVYLNFLLFTGVGFYVDPNGIQLKPLTVDQTYKPGKPTADLTGNMGYVQSTFIESGIGTGSASNGERERKDRQGDTKDQTTRNTDMSGYDTDDCIFGSESVLFERKNDKEKTSLIPFHRNDELKSRIKNEMPFVENKALQNQRNAMPEQEEEVDSSCLFGSGPEPCDKTSDISEPDIDDSNIFGGGNDKGELCTHIKPVGVYGTVNEPYVPLNDLENVGRPQTQKASETKDCIKTNVEHSVLENIDLPIVNHTDDSESTSLQCETNPQQHDSACPSVSPYVTQTAWVHMNQPVSTSSNWRKKHDVYIMWHWGEFSIANAFYLLKSVALLFL